jgi:hypothetical protein
VDQNGVTILKNQGGKNMAEEKKKLEYQSSWQDQIADVTKKILNREKFSYDVNGDALYKQYKDRYTQQGRQAMMDTMGQAQAMTGGYGNSYAQSVGQQTYQGYMQGLTDKIPTLYQIALDKYTNEGNQMRDNLNLMMQQDEIGYGRYRDQLADQNTAYSKLMALMTGYGYKPSDAEMEAAGMSASQRDAVLRLGAYAPVYYEEDEAPRKGAYVPPEAVDSSRYDPNKVLEVQKALNSMGWDVPETGNFDTSTRAAYAEYVQDKIAVQKEEEKKATQKTGTKNVGR